MSKTVGEWLFDMSKKTGVAENHEGLKPLLSISSVIPDDVYDALAGLMTVNEAKNNIKIKNHFISEFADAIDKSIPQLLAEAGIEEDKITGVVNEKATGKKVSLAMRVLADAKEAAAKAKVDKDPEALAKANQQIKEANEQVNKIKAEYEAKLSEKDGYLNAYKRKNELSKLSSLHQWSELYPESVRETLFNASLEAEMNKLGAVLDLEGEKLVLKQKADPALYFHHNNQEFTPSDLVAKVMTDNKFIAVAPKAAEPVLSPGFRTPLPGNGNGAKHNAPSAFQAALQKAKADQGV